MRLPFVLFILLAMVACSSGTPSREFMETARDASDAVEVMHRGWERSDEPVYQAGRVRAAFLLEKLWRLQSQGRETNIYFAISDFSNHVEGCWTTDLKKEPNEDCNAIADARFEKEMLQSVMSEGKASVISKPLKAK